MANHIAATRETLRDLLESLLVPLDEVPFDLWWSQVSEWPADVFALTWVLLESSGAYRLAVAPPSGHTWPPNDWPVTPEWRDTCQVNERITRWRKRVDQRAAQWREQVANRASPLWLGQYKDAISGALDVPLQELDWHVVVGLLELHAIVDAVYVGTGVGESPQDSHQQWIWRKTFEMLRHKGTVANWPTTTLRVLPKMRTPQSGLSMGSFSHHLCVVRSEVDVRWILGPDKLSGRVTDDGRLRLLVVPWPFSVEPSDFVPVREVSHPIQMDETFDFFTFDPEHGEVALELDATRRLLDTVCGAVRTANKSCGSVHGIVLPECSISVLQAHRLTKALRDTFGVDAPFLLAGVRDLHANYAEMSLVPGVEPIKQHKHHRWRLDGNQLRQYELASALSPAKSWWEHISLDARQLHFYAVGRWLTMCHLICEDLARQEPVASVVRAVGPTLVIALLMDGPQLGFRWAGRYASVLADDPGSSVLSVTSLGMVSRTQPPSRVVALWKDMQRGLRELRLDEGASALYLTIAPEWTEEWSADARRDHRTAACLVLESVEQIGGP